MFRILSGLPFYLETLKNLEFEIFLTLKILEFWTKNMEFFKILVCSVVKFRLDTKSLSFKKNFFDIIIHFFFFKHIKLNFKLKIDPKMRTFKNLEEIWKTWKKFRKKSATLLFFASLLFKKKDIRWIYIIVNLTYFDLLYPDWISRIE